MKDSVPPMMRNMIAITLQTTISKIGFLPDQYGDMVKSIIAGDDSAAVLALGCYLEDCEKDGNYEPLEKMKRSLENG